ncbi:MAG TPA: hypothetical protein VF450_21060 [Noviherbaspirillum sp.]
MSLVHRSLAALALAVVVASPAVARDGLDDFLNSVNVRAEANMQGFYATISAQFGVPDAQVRAVLSSVGEPASAFMIFELGQMSNQPVDRVMQVYRHGRNTGKGWGMLAKELGIKPGSREFHALKNGDLSYGGGYAASPGQGRGHEQGQGRGHNPHFSEN